MSNPRISQNPDPRNELERIEDFSPDLQEMIEQIRCAVGAARINHNLAYLLVGEGLTKIFTIGIGAKLQCQLFDMKTKINDPFEPKPKLYEILDLLDEIEASLKA